MTTFDTIIIGSGPGGYVAAIRAAQLGQKVAVIEKDAIGGRCLNYACIPAKATLRSADVVSDVQAARDFGIVVSEPTVDYRAIAQRRTKVVKTLTGGVAGLFRKNGIEAIEGEARLREPGVVTVDRTAYSAKNIVLATGSTKRTIPGVAYGGGVIGTEEAWGLGELPGRLAVLGAGASGAEVASAYARLGTQVMLFEVADRLLPTEDADISKLVARGFANDGIDVHLATPIRDVQTDTNTVTFSYGNQQAEVDWIVVCAGREADVAALGLDAAGVELDERGLVEVDGRMRTSAHGIWAIGDIVAGPALAHKASEEGIIAVEDAAGLATHPLTYPDIPRATFCTPNVASFGLTEAQARDAGYDVCVGKATYAAVGAGTVYGDRSGLVKLIGDDSDGAIIGGHIVGAKATDLIQELASMRDLEGGYAELARIPHGHPTMSEAILEAARDASGWPIHG